MCSLAEQPTDPRWPPTDDISFDGIMARLLKLKRTHFPQHTARDNADPFIQILRLIAALGQHAFQRANSALLKMNPSTATSRRALIAMMEIVARPLAPMQPGRGTVYAKLVSEPIAETTVIEKGVRITAVGSSDPVFSVDTAVTTGSSVSFALWFEDSSAETVTATPMSTSRSVDSNDGWIIGFDVLAFDAVTITLSVPHANPTVYCLEYSNEEGGQPDSVTELTTQLRLYVDEYLHSDTVTVAKLVGLQVTVRYKGTNTEETATVANTAGSATVTTSKLGQTSTVSTSPSDYEITASWRPVPDQTDGTSGMTASGEVSFDISSVLSETDWWEPHDSYGYALRMRLVSSDSTLPEAVTISALACEGSFFAIADITQGYVTSMVIGQTDGTAFQAVPLTADPIDEPVEDPAITLEVGSDTDWSIVDDLSNSGSESKHAVLREDVDDGWCVVFGDGGVGVIPDDGSSVKITYRTGSTESGDLDAATDIKALSSASLVRGWVLPRATSGYEAPEASTRESALRFRAEVIPQLALRAESVVTPSEIETALSGGAPNRATFETGDGRRPFSRALWTTTGASERQYRVIVVGDESDANGSVSTADLTEAQDWLNGTMVGIQTVGGHGPQNTEAVVGAFSPLSLRPIVSITARDTTGVQGQAEAILRSLLKPHAVDENEEWRWEFGGSIPVAVIFGQLWDGIPKRTSITITVSDGVTTYNLEDSINLSEFQLPVISDDFDASTDVTVTEVA